jgi:hypothetical protein
MIYWYEIQEKCLVYCIDPEEMQRNKESKI